MERLDEYDFELPQSAVAQEPAARREESRLLVLDRMRGEWSDSVFGRLPRFLREGDLLVLNDTRVLKARLDAVKLNPAPGGGMEPGARVELLLCEELGDGVWRAMCKPARRLKPGTRLRLAVEEEEIELVVEGAAGDGGDRVVRFMVPRQSIPRILETYGRTPLPPYIKNPPPGADERYQTVYAREPGAVAAPTAGLHFSRELLDSLREAGVGIAFCTLHVGQGTFLPLKHDEIEANTLHSERFRLPAETMRAVLETRRRGNRVVAVGTTSVRVLEGVGLERMEEAESDVEGETSLFIRPGAWKFGVVDAMITNFHLPKTSLLLLVCAFAGKDLVLRAYRHAVEAGYRFYSFGDAMLIV